MTVESPMRRIDLSSGQLPTQALLALAIQLVVFLFGAFGGYLDDMAPPPGPVGGVPEKWAAGYASFAGLLTFLALRSLVPLVPWPRITWWAISVSLAVAFLYSGATYQERMSELTFRFDLTDPPTIVILGSGPGCFDTLTTSLTTYIQEAGSRPRNAVAECWSSEALQSSHRSLYRAYTFMVFTLLASLAGFSQVLLGEGSPGQGTGVQEEARSGPR